MRYDISSGDRVFSMLASDNYTNPEKVVPILEREFYFVAKDYLNLSDEIKIRYKKTSHGLVFMVEIPISQMGSSLSCCLSC